MEGFAKILLHLCMKMAYALPKNNNFATAPDLYVYGSKYLQVSASVGPTWPNI